MYLGYILLFFILFTSCLVCIVVFRGYKRELAAEPGSVPVPFMRGFVVLLADLIFRSQSRHRDELLYRHRIKILSYILITFLICILIGAVYLLSLELQDGASITNISRPEVGEGDTTITVMAEHESYTGPIDITVEERTYTFDEVIEIFTSYRDDFDAYVLGDNASFLHVTSPLCFPSTVGDEDIAVSWHIDDTSLIGYDGNLSDDIPDEGAETDITATWTLGDISADICYHVKVYPATKDAKTILSEYIDSTINSDTNIYSNSVSLPDMIGDSAITYRKYSEPLPP